mmetsp:Transcript_6732/g.9854  ORF Transcript_6732/g.9854 Transcript_6732/m.9854 type:complete len:209 (-) Transcript_6732:987-1613(-)
MLQILTVYISLKGINDLTQPPALDVFLYIVHHLPMCVSFIPHAIRKHKCLIKDNVLHKRNRITMFVLSLTAKSADKIRRYRHFWNKSFDQINQIQIRLSTITASHALQYAARPALHRHVQLIANVISLGHEMEQLTRVILRMWRCEAYPQLRRDLAHRIEQIGKVVPSIFLPRKHIGKISCGCDIAGSGIGQHCSIRSVMIRVHVLSE